MRKTVLIDLLLFAVTVYVAWWKNWQVGDLAWSLWISSLTLGYLYILVSIIGTLAHGPAGLFKSQQSRQDDKPPKPPGHPIVGVIGPVVFLLFLTGFSKFTLYVLPYALLVVFLKMSPILRQRPGWGFLPNIPPGIGDFFIALPVLLFLLAFFTVHFGGFHMVHGMFLNEYFPLLQKVPSAQSPMGEIPQFKELIRTALVRYWFFVLVSGLNSWKNFAHAFRINDGSMMFRPYLNVIRMHIMIFVFAVANAFKFQSTALYIMLALYFFPVISLVGLFKKKGNVSTVESAMEPKKAV
ncbi:MAG TPA: hypothetical protein VGB38_06800 [bacterium]